MHDSIKSKQKRKIERKRGHVPSGRAVTREGLRHVSHLELCPFASVVCLYELKKGHVLPQRGPCIAMVLEITISRKEHFLQSLTETAGDIGQQFRFRPEVVLQGASFNRPNSDTTFTV